MKLSKILLILLTIILTTSFCLGETVVRIKDIAKVSGVAENQLIGYGVVVGLAGTGDSTRTIMTAISIANMLNQLGMSITKEQMNSKNVAAVMVTAKLPPFVRNGDTIDVTVASLGDASSIQGGVLLFTPLAGADGKVYGSAQGPLSIGGFNAGTGGGDKVFKNHALVGRIPKGGLVNRDFSSSMVKGNELLLSLNEADFTTAQRMAVSIQNIFGSGSAMAIDGGTVKVIVPPEYQGRDVELISRIEELTLVPDEIAKVIINERTGTVVINKDVKLSPVAVAHGNITVVIKNELEVSQPLPFSQGTTQTGVKSNVEVTEQKVKLITLSEGTTLKQVVSALNAIGVTPRDLIAILQALKQAGSLQGELVII